MWEYQKWCVTKTEKKEGQKKRVKGCEVEWLNLPLSIGLSQPELVGLGLLQSQCYWYWQLQLKICAGAAESAAVDDGGGGGWAVAEGCEGGAVAAGDCGDVVSEHC